MSDFKTGVAHFYGKPIPDLQPNKSMSILYVLLGPTCSPNDIEYACIWHDAIITESQHDQVNSGALGESGTGAEHNIQFRGIFDRSPQVDLLATLVVDRYGLYEERSWNALLPQYIYDEYFTGNGPDAKDYSVLVADRLQDEIGLETYKAYEDSGKAAYNTINGNVPNGTVPDNSLLQQQKKASPQSITVSDK
jgi:hypothetical protein